MHTDTLELIKNTSQELIERLGFVATVEVLPPVAPRTAFLCSVHIEKDQNFLIGQYGMNLAALQHPVRILVRKRLEDKLDIIVDINNYYTEKKQLLEKEAEHALAEAFQKNEEVILRPMLPYERKIIHSFLSTNAHVQTESIGAGEERRVVIRPLDMESRETSP